VTTELPDGRLEVTATVADTPQLEWWLRGMGCEVVNYQDCKIQNLMQIHHDEIVKDG